MAAKWAEKDYANRIYCYKLFPEAHMPVKGSDLAACFDLKASMRDGDEIKFYNKQNVKSGHGKWSIKKSPCIMVTGC